MAYKAGDEALSLNTPPSTTSASSTPSPQSPNLDQHHLATKKQSLYNPDPAQSTRQLHNPSSDQDRQRFATDDMSYIPFNELAALSLDEPYGCTYLCGGTFPTSLEWRQHELRSHRQTETWRCNVPLADAVTACGATFYAPDSLATHLVASHGCVAEKTEDRAAWVEDGHIHPEGQVNFWCGFCRVIVPLASRGVEAWAERLDHLQDHFDNGDSLAKGWLRLRNEVV